MNQYIRHASGRLRMTWPHLKNDPVRIQAAEAELSLIRGVMTVRASSLSGNLFIRYDARRIEPVALVASVRQTMSNVVSAHPVRSPPVPHPSIHRSLPAGSRVLGEKLGNMLVNVVVEKAVERLGIALVAAVL